jgi:hypothetical protein
MTVTASRPSQTTPDGADALFKEARRRRRRRYSYSGLVLVLLACLGVALNHLSGSTPKRSPKAHATTASGPRSTTRLLPSIVTPRQPGPLALAPNGDLYIADDALNEILARLPSGAFKVVAGTGKAGFSGDDGPAKQAELNRPQGMAVASNGTLFVADTGNSRVRAILPNGMITTIAGNGLAATGPAGTPVITGTPAETAIGPPTAVALGGNGALYIAASDAVVELTSNNTLIDVVDPENDAGFAADEPQNNQCEPASIAVDGSGDLYVGCSDPYVLVERLATGALRPLGSDRPHDAVAALVASPGGDVLAIDGFGVVQYGPTGQHLMTNYLSQPLPNNEDFEPQGIAVRRDGTLYLSQDGVAGIGPPTIVKRSVNGKTTLLWEPVNKHVAKVGPNSSHLHN